MTVEEAQTSQISDSIDHSRTVPLCKYCADDDQVIKGIFETGKIRFTQPWALNDPLKANPVMRFKDLRDYQWFCYDGVTLPSREWWIRLYLIQQRISGFGILSLTEIPDSFDMWSRYANGHKGFLLHFKMDFNLHSCMLSRDGCQYPVRGVEYPLQHLIDIEEVVDEYGRFQEKVVHNRLFFQKVSRWQAEREHRMVRRLSDLDGYEPLTDKLQRDDRIHLFPFSLDCVLAVTLGACMSVEKKRRIVRICDDSGISWGQAWIVRDESERAAQGGKMGAVRLGPMEESPRLIDICPCILDSDHMEEEKSKTEIASLAELPYWGDNPEWVQELFENRKKREQAKL